MKLILPNSMDSSQPTSLDDYCRHFNCSFFDLRIRCIFCRHFLDLIQLADFHSKTLSLVWRGCECFACCTNCARLSAKFEFESYYRCSIPAVIIEDIVKQKLHQLIVRCYLCLRLLDTVEKYDSVCRGDSFHLVRQGWKGICRICASK
uniref:Protein E6 n=1 Tax=Human papillomavirus TaxID=10566 RepID=A0A385PLG2_9PAPI|nr:MAG: E6 protein [Human papillomavirus]